MRVLLDGTTEAIKRKPIYMCTDLELAYAAGIIDGEGTIVTDKQKSSYCIVVRLYNTDARLIQWFSDRFDGFSYLSYAAKGNRKACFAWAAKTRKACKFLKLIVPFLVIKQKQAHSAILLQELKDKEKLSVRRDVEKILADTIKLEKVL